MELCLEAGLRIGKTGSHRYVFAFLCGRVDGSAISGKGKVKQIDESSRYRMVKKKHLKNVIKELAGSHILWWIRGKRRGALGQGRWQSNGQP